MPPIVHNNFNAETVALSESNLIEASAGTGKTYSIALLTLRLIIEKNIPIKNILMVTFTKAAVAELELRVRSFVRMALKVSRGQAIADNTISRMVNDQILEQGQEVVKEKLENALLLLDETSVLTIHSFCQRTLSEFSFETGQIFGAETITPDEYNQLIEDAYNEYWRTKVTTLRVDILKRLIPVDLKYKVLLGLLKQDLGGKLLFSKRPIPANFLSNEFQDDIVAFETGVRATIDNDKNSIIDNLISNRETLLTKITSNKNASNAFLQFFNDDSWDSLIIYISDVMQRRNPPPPAYIRNIFGTIVDDILALQALENSIQFEFEVIVNQITVDAIKYVKEIILEVKSNRGIITFDDMIRLLYNAVMFGTRNQELIQSLQNKYEAIFIDEFQDTDKEQYAIFDKLFGHGKILFYIGDPKQSIYAFRKADIFTYFTASNHDVQHKHLMNTNHRSTESYIHAMNEFFLPTANFDTFHFNNDPTIANAISYINVGSPIPNTKGSLLYQGKPTKPIKISKHKNEKELLKGVVNILKDLFSPGNYSILKDAIPEPIKPSDVGVLVRTKNEAKVIKDILTNLRIPAITIDDTRLLATKEAKQIFYILEAVNEISRANVNRALLSDIGGYNDTKLLNSDEESILLQFRTYQETWEKYGVYSMLKQFISDHDVYNRLFDNSTENPERTISNVQQLIEILHKISVKKNYEPKELIQWLKKGMEGDTREGDEYEQRLESDQDAVQIVTIHKSKGLEYNIVIAPHLDLLRDKRGFKTGSYRDPNGEYYISKKGLMSAQQNELYLRQSEQENRRLLYVAITRARYQCFITSNSSSSFSTSSLRTFYNALEQNKESLQYIEFVEEYLSVPNFVYANAATAAQPVYAVANNFNLQQPNWIKTSYSGLNPDHDVLPAPKLTQPLANSYDKFVFQELKKGAHTGNLLHYIFEHIDFVDDRNWTRVVEQAMKRLSGSANEDYRDQIGLLLNQVTSATMPGENAFKLNQVPIEKRLNELEFDFLLSPFNTAKLQSLSSDVHPFRIKSIDELEGIMNGKIDLFFEYEGKYYILDWKSNFLGNSLEFYDTDHIKAAMYENNYNLQYLIYTVALTKYLELRKPDFDYDRDFGGVIYLFLRGVRAEGQSGIYFTKPAKQLIEDIKSLMTI